MTFLFVFILLLSPGSCPAVAGCSGLMLIQLVIAIVVSVIVLVMIVKGGVSDDL